MKNIEWKKQIIWFIVSWFSGLLFIMAYTRIKYDMPSFQDLIGFGGLLLFSCIMLIPFFYNPLMWLSRKLNFHNSWLRVLLLVVVGNIPIYLIMYKQYKDRMSIPEARLFLAGYITIAIVWGLLFQFKQTIKTSVNTK